MSIKKEASIAANIKGFSAPFGAKVKKKKKSKNMLKPFGEASLFENMVTQAELNGQNIDDVVRKRGERWVLYDDDTNVEISSFPSREDAWERQRQKRQAKKTKNKFSRLEKQRKKAQNQQLQQNKETNESIKITEANMISYVFENSPISSDSLGWDNFVSSLSRQVVLSDPKLKSILQKTAKAEFALLNKSVDIIKNVLTKTKTFNVEKKKTEQNPETGDTHLNFEVVLKQNKQKVPLSIKLENGRPLVVFPEEAKNILNSLANDESKLLRAELIHIQETTLNNMSEIVDINKQRDEYLKKLEDKVDNMLKNTNPLEIAIIRHLIKMKFKGIK